MPRVALGATALSSARFAASAPSKEQVWGLWNEGNLYSLAAPEMVAYVSANSKAPLDEETKGKKSALVKKIDELMAAESGNLANPDAEENTSSNVEVEARESDLLDEADHYGDWGVDPSYRRGNLRRNFIEVTQAGLEGEMLHVCAPRAYQLLHDSVSSDVALKKFDASKLPGCGKMKEVYTTKYVDPEEANKERFAKAFAWTVENMWNVRHVGEICIGAGKALYWRKLHKANKGSVPIWTAQEQLHQLHPYTWFAVAHETNTGPVAELVTKLGMTPTQEAETTYKCTILRKRDQLDVELNKELKVTNVNYPWDRFLMTHYIRSTMPDIRFLMRSRARLSGAITTEFEKADVLKMTADSVEPILASKKGEVVYCCERVVRKWGTKLNCGATVQLKETRRTPLIVTRTGEEGERLEYEIIANLPTKTENINLNEMSAEIWEKTKLFVATLEDGMADFGAHTMSAADAFAASIR